MPKDNKIILAVLVIGVIALFASQNGNETPNNDGGGGGVDLCTVVNPSVSFTGKNMFLAGTATTSDFVRVLRMNGEIENLGQKSLDSGTLSTSPGTAYKFYFGENSTTFYTNLKDYDGLCQEAVDDVSGKLCTIDTTPTITVFDEFGNVQTATTFAQAIGADEVKEIKVRVRVSADQCYGNPSAPKDNAVCIKYPTTAIQSVKASTGSSAVPYLVSSTYSAASNAISCYNLEKLADNGEVDIPFTITATSTEPTQANANMTVYIDDIAFDLDADTLDEIWNFEDEDNNELGTSAVTNKSIYIS